MGMETVPFSQGYAMIVFLVALAVIFLLAAFLVPFGERGAEKLEGTGAIFDVGLKKFCYRASTGFNIYTADFDSIGIEHNQDMDVIPVLVYRESIGYDKGSIINVRDGEGKGSAIIVLSDDSPLNLGEQLVTLTFWRWGENSCVRRVGGDLGAGKTISELSDACASDYVGLTRVRKNLTAC